MTTVALDPLIHHPARLRVVAIPAALPGGDTLSVTRLQDMIRIPPGSLIICLRELDHAGYVRTGKTGGSCPRTGSAVEHRPPSPSPATTGPRRIATPRCCGSCPGSQGE